LPQPESGAGGQVSQILVNTDLVRIDEVTKTFGEKTALSGISFTVPTGQICGLVRTAPGRPRFSGS
jgi:hypothetical protein